MVAFVGLDVSQDFDTQQQVANSRQGQMEESMLFQAVLPSVSRMLSISGRAVD